MTKFVNCIPCSWNRLGFVLMKNLQIEYFILTFHFYTRLEWKWDGILETFYHFLWFWDEKYSNNYSIIHLLWQKINRWMYAGKKNPITKMMWNLFSLCKIEQLSPNLAHFSLALRFRYKSGNKCARDMWIERHREKKKNAMSQFNIKMLWFFYVVRLFRIIIIIGLIGKTNQIIACQYGNWTKSNDKCVYVDGLTYQASGDGLKIHSVDESKSQDTMWEL